MRTLRKFFTNAEYLEGMAHKKMAISWYADANRDAAAALGTGVMSADRRVSQIGVAIGDLAGKIHDANDAYLKIHGWARAELSNINWIAFTPDDWKPKTASAMSAFTIDKLATTFQTEHFHKDGHRVPLSITLMRITGSDLLLCTVTETTAYRRTSTIDARSAYFQAKRRFGLTYREHEVLASIIDGLSNAEIATGLAISAATVSDHVQSVMRKLDVKNRSRIFMRVLTESPPVGESFVKASVADVTIVAPH
jgi:PAS domain S-box-containing protein